MPTPSLRDAARYATEVVGAARGASGKLAQLADFIDPAWIPEEHHQAGEALLRALRSGATEPIAFRGVERILTAAWDEPISAHLSALDPEPAALASCGQVHRGTLHDGREVAVKVLHPGTEAALRNGLDVLASLARLVGGWVPQADVAGLLGELRERLLDEIDLEHEASVMRAFSRAYREHPHVWIPAPESSLCAADVLVSEWAEGTPFEVVTGLEGRDRYGEVLARFFLGAPLHTGLIHADPHPGNHRLLHDGRLAILDFGASGRMEPSRMAHVLDTAAAARRGDGPGVVHHLHALGYLPDGPADAVEDALAHLRRALPWLIRDEPVRLDPGLIEPVLEVAGEAVRGARALRIPADDLQLGRMAAGLGLVLTRLEASAAWGRLLGEIAGDVEPATDVGREEAEHWARRGHSRADRVHALRDRA